MIDGAEILEPLQEDVEHIEDEGNNATFRCAGEGYPLPLVQWRKINGSLSDRVSVTIMSVLTGEGNVTRLTSDLGFTEAYREDTGVYECLVSNLLNSVTRSIDLTIQCM